MTGWILFAFSAGFILGAVVMMVCGLYLSRRNLRQIGAVAGNTIPMKGTTK